MRDIQRSRGAARRASASAAKDPSARKQLPGKPPSDPGPSAISRRRAAARAQGRKNYAERRAEIIKVGAEVFKRNGFGRTTLAHVAEALGTDRASLYYYVGSKEELFEEIVSDAMSVNLATAIAIRDGEGTAAEKLRNLIQSLMQSYEEFYPVLYVLIQENLSHASPQRAKWAEEMRRVNHDYEEVLIDIVEDGMRDRSLRHIGPPWLMAYGVIGMVAWTNRWFNPNRSKVSAGEVGSVFAEMLLCGLAAEG